MMCLTFFMGDLCMRKLRFVNSEEEKLTFSEGCELYLMNCRQRNLREGTIGHYRQSYTQFYKYFDPEMPVGKFNAEIYNKYVMYLCDTLDNDISVNSYLRDLITTLHFLMNEGYVKPFKMTAIKTDASHVETYTDEELTTLLKKPDIKTCSFIEFQCWVMTNLLFSTGIRQRSLLFLQVEDVDFDNRILHVKVTKNRKALIIPLNTTMCQILREFLRHRQHKGQDDWLFCNVFGKQLVKATCYHMLYQYNKGRGVETTGIHRYRHTFAKQWIMNGGNVVSLSRLLGHSNLSITQNYINLLVSDLSVQVDEMNILDKFAAKKHIRM